MKNYRLFCYVAWAISVNISCLYNYFLLSNTLLDTRKYIPHPDKEKDEK